MKRIFLLVILAVSTFVMQAQTTVKGVVLDSLTRAGEPAAVIQLFSSDDTSHPAAYTVTAEDGSFSMEVHGQGGYELMVSNVGRRSRKVLFETAGGGTLDLGDILVTDDVLTLKAGSVTAQKTLVVMDVDKITYKVEDDVDARTGTILDMLRKVPMVSVDGQDNITVNGSSSFQVYVDGKPNQMLSSNPSQILKHMPASMARSIEVITNPGAKYDAEGVGGVLNITTNLSKTEGNSLADGQYGSVTLKGSTRGFGGGMYYSFQKGKWTMSLNGNATKTYNDGTVSEIERIHKTEDGDFITRTYGEADIRTPLYTGNLNLSYEIDSLNLVSIGAGYLGSNLSYGTLFNTGFSSPYSEYAYAGNVLSITASHSITANADYQHTWAGHKNRSIVISYLFSATPSYSEVTNIFDDSSSEVFVPVDSRTDGFTNSLSHTAQMDFSTPLGHSSGHTLNVGTKFTARHNSSDQKGFILGTDGNQKPSDGSVDYDFYNNIGAAYAEYEGKYGPVGLKAGVRYEHTWQNVKHVQGRDYSLDYGSFVPVASLQYNIDMQQNVGVAYNMRISRPGITYLNPYVDDLSDPTTRTYGNPDLKAENGHTISVIYNRFTPKWIVNLTLRQGFTGNGISQYSFYDDSGILNTTYGNVVSTSTSGINAFVTWIPGQKTRIIFNGGGSYTDIRSQKLDQRNNGWTYNALLGLQQTLPLDIRVSMNMIASGRTFTLQGWTSGMILGTLGITRNFLDDRLGLSLSGLTHLTGGRGMKIDSISETKDFANRTSTAIPLRMISLDISFSFGKPDSVKVKKSRKSIEADTQLNTQSMSQSLGTVVQM